MLNVSKTHHMVIGMKYCADDNINVRIGNKLVKRVFVTRFLGVLINAHLNWKYHIRMLWYRKAMQFNLKGACMWKNTL